jgi:hypothetical protein
MRCVRSRSRWPDAHAEDAAAPEEQRADEEDARREDADCRMGAVRQVLVDRTGSGVLAGVERERVADGEHAEPRQEDRQGRVEGGSRRRARDQAEHDRGREHRPDRKGLGDRVNFHREVLLAKLL